MGHSHADHGHVLPGHHARHDHGPRHDHDHHDHHHHHHLPLRPDGVLAAGMALNALFVAVEAAAGLWSGSMALLADAGHNLSDVLGLTLALTAVRLARRRPTAQRTYGFKKGTVLSALANSVGLLVLVGAMAWEAVERLQHPVPVPGLTVVAVAGAGMVVNALSAGLLHLRTDKRDANLHGAMLHLLGDAAVSLGVVVAGLVMMGFGWAWIDPLTSLLIAAVVLWSTWDLLRHSLDLALDAAPRGLDVEAVRRWLTDQPGVLGLHDLHVWALSTTEPALTAHLDVEPERVTDPNYVRQISAGLHENFGIDHATLQVEPVSAEVCRTGPGCEPHR